MELNILNLFSSLIGASMTAFLGSVVYFHDRRSATNKIFIIHSAVGTLWAIATYFSLSTSPENVLFWIRAVIFFAVPHIFLFFLFVLNFPNDRLVVRDWKLFGILLVMIGLMILASTPFAFEGIRLVDERNVVPVPGILMPVFGILMVIFFAWTVVLVVIKFFHTVDVVRRQWLAIGAGLLIAYSLLIFFVFLRVI